MGYASPVNPLGRSTTGARGCVLLLYRYAPVIAVCTAVAGCATNGFPGPADRQAVIDRIVAASAKITLYHEGRRVASGSGVVIEANPDRQEGPASYILTAAHLFDGRQDVRIFVRLPSSEPSSAPHQARLLRRTQGETADLALLEVSGVAVEPALLAEDGDVRLGAEIFAVGFPWGKRLGVFSGIVSQVPDDHREEPAASEEAGEHTLTVDAAASRGMSGGGVFLASTGRLLGIVEGFQTASIAVKGQSQTYSVKVPMPGETFVVPISRIRRFLEEAGVAVTEPASDDPRSRTK